VTFAGVVLVGNAFAGADEDIVGRVGPAPLVAALSGAAFTAGIGGSLSESSLSESSSLSLSLGFFAEALAGSVFEGTTFGMALVTELGESSESLPLDSEEEDLALGSGALNCHGQMNRISVLLHAPFHLLRMVSPVVLACHPQRTTAMTRYRVRLSSLFSFFLAGPVQIYEQEMYMHEKKFSRHY